MKYHVKYIFYIFMIEIKVSDISITASLTNQMK